jgi:hypothetical protein
LWLLLQAGTLLFLRHNRLQLPRSTDVMRTLKSRNGKLKLRDKPRGLDLCQRNLRGVKMKISLSLLA